MTDISPEEAKKVWDSLTTPSIRGVHRSLTAAGCKVSLQTIANWKRNGWSRRPPDRPSPKDQIEQILPAVTDGKHVRIDEYLAGHPVAQRLAGLSPAELEELRIESGKRLEIALSEDLQAKMGKMDPKQRSDAVVAISRLRAENLEHAKWMEQQAPERAKNVTPLPGKTPGIPRDHPLYQDFMELGQVGPNPADPLYQDILELGQVSEPGRKPN